MRSNQKGKKDYEQDEETGKQGHVDKKAPAAHGAGPHCECALGWEEPLEEKIANPSNIIKWGIPWTDP